MVVIDMEKHNYISRVINEWDDINDYDFSSYSLDDMVEPTVTFYNSIIDRESRMRNIINVMIFPIIESIDNFIDQSLRTIHTIHSIRRRRYNTDANINANTNINAIFNTIFNANSDANFNTIFNANTGANNDANSSANTNTDAIANANISTNIDANTNTNISANNDTNISPNVGANTNFNTNTNTNTDTTTNFNSNTLLNIIHVIATNINNFLDDEYSILISNTTPTPPNHETEDNNSYNLFDDFDSDSSYSSDYDIDIDYNSILSTG